MIKAPLPKAQRLLMNLGAFENAKGDSIFIVLIIGYTI